MVARQEVTEVLLAPIKVVMVILRVGGTGSVVTAFYLTAVLVITSLVGAGTSVVHGRRGG